MDRALTALLERQFAEGFRDLQGAEGSISLPVSDRLLNEIISGSLPPGGPVRELQVRARDDNRFDVRVKVGSSPFFPAVNLTVVIERQPDLPSSPVLVMRLEMSGLMAMAGPALRFLDKMPPGIRVEGEQIHVDIAALLAQRGFGAALPFLDQLRVTTAEGVTVVSLRGCVRS